MKRFLRLVTLCVLWGQISVSLVSCGSKDGGWSEKESNPEANRIAGYVLHQLRDNGDIPKNSAVKEIESFAIQVVSGTNYKLVFSCTSGEVVLAKVYETLDEKLSLDSYEIK